MPGGHRRDRGALVALALMLLAIVAVAWITNEPPDQAIGQQPADATEYPQEQQGPAEGRWFPEFAARDTYAQWIMAAFGIAATAISLWAVRLLDRTLNATTRATEAALKTVCVTREIGAAQMRPWVMFSNIRVDGVSALQTDPGEKVFITFALSASVTNSGAGAANKTTIFAASCTVSELYKYHDKIVAGELTGGQAGSWTGMHGPILLAPDAEEEYSCRLSIHIDAPTPEKPFAMEPAFYLVAKYIAVIGGKEHVTSQCYIIMDDRETNRMPSIERLNESRAASVHPFSGTAI